MNLRNWGKQHTIGLILGIALPLLFLPLLVLLMSLAEGYSFSFMWERFVAIDSVKSKFVSLSVIINMPVFYYFLNKEKWPYGMGMIVGSMLYVPVILYFNFLT